jgi:UDP-N-acetylglucosamine 2-epimerase (hydrolysing)
MSVKKILFLTGTRADFGKLKSLIDITSKDESFEVSIFATGMHLSITHGYTVDEIEKCGYKNILKFINHTESCTMDQILAQTINGFSECIHSLKPDLIVIHGDRVEALAGAICGALNNILVAHIEGGEISGTIDEVIRHAVTKMSHIHFVANETAKRRIIQLGELEKNIFVIGSPDIDAMLSPNLPTISEVRKRYEIDFSEYSIAMFHPVTTEIEMMPLYAKNFVDSIIKTNDKMVVIYPNNDLGYKFIIDEYNRLVENKNFRIFPSIRFEFFVVLLKYSKYLIGNSSAGIREAPYYGVPTINIGTRQNNRAISSGIINCGYHEKEILQAINKAKNTFVEKTNFFGAGNSYKLFIDLLRGNQIWAIDKQKHFNDIKMNDA